MNFLVVPPCVLLALALLCLHGSLGFTVAPAQSRATLACSSQRRCRGDATWLASLDPRKSPVEEETKEMGILDLIFNPYQSKIPKEIEKDIFAAEGNTPAAKERTARVGWYAMIAFGGILVAFFNAFLSELRNAKPEDGGVVIDLVDAGFGWVYSNVVFEFIFTNKIGGLLFLLLGGASGLLAEAEYDSRRINAEKIFDELQRRRGEPGNNNNTNSSGRRQKNSSDESAKRNKRRSGKESKRLSALSEVASLSESSTSPLAATVATTATKDTPSTIAVNTVDASVTDSGQVSSSSKVTVQEDDSILGKLKDFYNQVDGVAASQALLLNKKLEDEGLIEKITDETGLRVIGKEAAEKLKTEREGK